MIDKKNSKNNTFATTALLSFFCSVTALAISLEMWREGILWTFVLGWLMALGALVMGVLAFVRGRFMRQRWMGLRIALALAVGAGAGGWFALTLDVEDGRLAAEHDRKMVGLSGSCVNADDEMKKWLGWLTNQKRPPHRVRVSAFISTARTLEEKGCRQDWSVMNEKLFDLERADWKKSGRWVWIPSVKKAYWPSAADGCLIEAKRSGLAQDRARCLVGLNESGPWVPPAP